MFNKEFYPTNKETLDLMNLDLLGKVIYEPHAGKGDIVKYCKSKGAKSVSISEINDDLRLVASKYADNVIGKDFFDVTEKDVVQFDLILMNPPFSDAHKHIIHAFTIAPEGCEVVSLCNYETISKGSSYRQLASLIRDYGTGENIGDCFSTAERKTGIDIGLVKLFKPVVSKEADYSGFFLDDEQEEENHVEGIMPFNEVRACVNRYVGAMKVFDKLEEQQILMNNTLHGLGVSGISLNLGYNHEVKNKAEFGKMIQKSSWQHIFNKMKLDKYVTSGVKKDINKFVETQTQIPFTMKNIYKMFEIIVGTSQETFNRAIEEVIDNFTKYTHENRFNVEGWKTNSGYMLNRKFIVERAVEQRYSSSSLRISLSGAIEKLKDLTKVLCSLTGTNYDNVLDIKYSPCDKNENGYLTSKGNRIENINKQVFGDSIHKFDSFDSNKWYEWGFFEFKCFKKGSMHLKFKNEKDWYVLNQAYGKLKGFTLPNKI
jgi:hypothetical protein